MMMTHEALPGHKEEAAASGAVVPPQPRGPTGTSRSPPLVRSFTIFCFPVHNTYVVAIKRVIVRGNMDIYTFIYIYSVAICPIIR